jgi:hypothetical protein
VYHFDDYIKAKGKIWAENDLYLNWNVSRKNKLTAEVTYDALKYLIIVIIIINNNNNVIINNNNNIYQ